ncbi:MFS transporter [Rhodococcus daqingensis]|uniref:MFS transporter n=1 Tax=Rhodococcus daqingensis TaxID=2479363 RepID=A0ABW2S4T3_9NOCA
MRISSHPIGSESHLAPRYLDEPREGSARCRGLFLVFAIVAASIALRPPLTVIGPLSDTVHMSTGLSSSAIGVLTTLPLIIFMLLSTQVPRISRRLGIEGAMLVAFVLVALGSLMRWVPSTLALYLGTAVLACGLTVPNVLLPSIIRRDFPSRIGSMTSMYTTLMAGAAGVASFLALPLAIDVGWGWRVTAASTGLLAAIAALAWLPLTRVSQQASARPAEQNPLWRSSTAWWVALFFATQTLTFYSVVAWLVPVLTSKHLTPAVSGAFLGGFSVVGIASSLLAPTLAARQRSQSAIAAAFGGIQVVGVVGLASANDMTAGFFALVFGMGAAGSFAVAFALFGLRAPNHKMSSQLSGMSQTVGYGAAAVGPILFGYFHDLFGNWRVLLGTLVVLAVASIALGILAGRPKFVPAGVTGADHP